MTAGAADLQQAAARARQAAARTERRIAWATIAAPAASTALAFALALSGVAAPGPVELAVLAALYLLTTLGITVGFHRLFTHLSFAAPRPVRLAFGILGSMAAQGPLLYWVAAHRQHHRRSDRPHDPHSPYLKGEDRLDGLAGFLHAHTGWMLEPQGAANWAQVPDLLRDRTALFISHRYFAWVAAGLLLPAAISGLWHGSLAGAALGLLWGGLVRIFLQHHATWSVNSLGHMVGRRRFATQDESRNNAFVAAITLGEGWHNNHHAFPYSARHGLAWWEIDPSWLAIRLLAWLGLASDLKTPRPHQIERQRSPAPGPGDSA